LSPTLENLLPEFSVRQLFLLRSVSLRTRAVATIVSSLILFTATVARTVQNKKAYAYGLVEKIKNAVDSVFEKCKRIVSADGQDMNGKEE
jgi:hypothetical protein